MISKQQNFIRTKLLRKVNHQNQVRKSIKILEVYEVFDFWQKRHRFITATTKNKISKGLTKMKVNAKVKSKTFFTKVDPLTLQKFYLWCFYTFVCSITEVKQHLAWLVPGWETWRGIYRCCYRVWPDTPWMKIQEIFYRSKQLEPACTGEGDVIDGNRTEAVR